MSDRTIIEGGSPESPGGPKTLIEGGGSGTPADGRTVLEQSGSPVGQSPIGINSIHLAPGVQIAGCVLRDQLRVISGEADLWLAEQPGRQELTVLKVFRWGVQPKAEVAEKLRSISKAQVVEVLGSGVLADGRHYQLLEYIREGTLANLMQPGGVSSALAQQILLELTEALTEVHAAGILHRDLKPSNILVRRREPLDLVLTDFGISSLSDQSSLYVTTAHRTAAYSAPEAMTGVIGSSSDWWSVGVMLLELLTGRHPFAGMDERIVNFQLVSRGIEIPASLSDEWQLLLKGLLTRDHQKRWGGEEVRAWLGGQRDIPVFYQTGPQQAAQYKPYKFLGKDCATPAELAREAGQAKNWDEGLKSLQRRYIQDWVKQDVRDFDLLSKLQDIEDDKKLDWEQKLCAALLVLDPELPLCWRGEIVTPDWISARAVQGTKSLKDALFLLSSSLPEWMQRCRNQTWILETRQRRQRLQSEIAQLGINLERADVDRVIFLPFEAVGVEANRRREAVHSAATDADESLTTLLTKPKWNEAECVAVVACPYTRFLTKEQRRLEGERPAPPPPQSTPPKPKASAVPLPDQPPNLVRLGDLLVALRNNDLVRFQAVMIALSSKLEARFRADLELLRSTGAGTTAAPSLPPQPHLARFRNDLVALISLAGGLLGFSCYYFRFVQRNAVSFSQNWVGMSAVLGMTALVARSKYMKAGGGRSGVKRGLGWGACAFYGILMSIYGLAGLPHLAFTAVCALNCAWLAYFLAIPVLRESLARNTRAVKALVAGVLCYLGFLLILDLLCSHEYGDAAAVLCFIGFLAVLNLLFARRRST